MHFLSGFSLIPEFYQRHNAGMAGMLSWSKVFSAGGHALSCHHTLINPKVFVLLSSLVKKLAIFSLSQKKILPWSTFHIPWYWWELGSLGMIPNCVHTWGFRHTGMGWRSQQTLNCKGDECLRTWKQKRTSYGETDSAKGLGIEGDQHFH